MVSSPMARTEELRLFEALGLEVPSLRGELMDRTLLQGPGGNQQRLVAQTPAANRDAPVAAPTRMASAITQTAVSETTASTPAVAGSKAEA